ncbi:MAG: hypothetical protein WC551_02685 [Patescibacteria group bacterium]
MEDEQKIEDSETSQNTDGEATENVPTLEDYKELEKKNKQLFARLKKTEEEVQKTKLKSDKPESSDDGWKEMMELRVEGYDDKEVEFLMRNGGKKAKEDALVKTAINAMREQKKAENAAVDDSSSKSDIERKYTLEQLREMPTAEMEKILKTMEN